MASGPGRRQALVTIGEPECHRAWSKWPAVRTILKSVTESGPYMEKYVLEAFFVMNDAKDGLARMRQRYSSMIQSSLTTLWEVWTPVLNDNYISPNV